MALSDQLARFGLVGQFLTMESATRSMSFRVAPVVACTVKP